MNSPALSPLDNLAEEHATIVGLIELIKQEQTQLIDADIDGLAQLTEEKAKLVAKMAELANRRHTALEAWGLKPEDKSMENWINSERNTLASKTWNDLLSLVATAKELNRLNGTLINKHMTRNQTALNALHSAPQGGNFYGPNGQSTVKTSTRRLVVG